MDGVAVSDGFRVACGYCGWRGELLGTGAEVRSWVAREVGHEMPTLSVAVAHVECPRCERTRMELAR